MLEILVLNAGRVRIDTMTELPRVGGSISSLAWMSLLGIVFFVVTIISLHVLQADLKPLDEAMSYYVHGSQGWLPTVGLIGLLGVWSVGVLLGAFFPADPPGH